MIGSCTSFVDSQAAADLMQESRLKLATLIGVELFRGRKTEKKLDTSLSVTVAASWFGIA